MVYDITKKESLDDIENFWIGEVDIILFRLKKMRFQMYSFYQLEIKLIEKNKEKLIDKKLKDLLKVRT